MLQAREPSPGCKKISMTTQSLTSGCLLHQLQFPWLLCVEYVWVRDQQTLVNTKDELKARITVSTVLYIYIYIHKLLRFTKYYKSSTFFSIFFYDLWTVNYKLFWILWFLFWILINPFFKITNDYCASTRKRQFFECWPIFQWVYKKCLSFQFFSPKTCKQVPTVMFSVFA